MFTKLKNKFLPYSIAVICLSFLFTNSYAVNIGTNKNVSGRASNITLQSFNKKGQLQYIIFGSKGDTKGVDIALEDMLVDFINPELKDVNLINASKDLKLYPLSLENEVEVENFWKKYHHAEAFIHTKNTLINTVDKTARGEDKVELRSKLIDIDGVGFYADYQNKTIKIKSKVEIIVRLENLQNQQQFKLNNSKKKKEKTDNSGKVKNEKQEK